MAPTPPRLWPYITAGALALISLTVLPLHRRIVTLDPSAILQTAGHGHIDTDNGLDFRGYWLVDIDGESIAVNFRTAYGELSSEQAPAGFAASKVAVGEGSIEGNIGQGRGLSFWRENVLVFLGEETNSGPDLHAVALRIDKAMVAHSAGVQVESTPVYRLVWLYLKDLCVGLGSDIRDAWIHTL